MIPATITTSSVARTGRIIVGEDDVSDVPTGALQQAIIDAANAGMSVSYEAVRDAAIGPLKADERGVPRAERYRSGKNPKDGMK